MGALLFTVLWVAMVPLGVFVLVNTVASVRNGDTDAVRNGLLLDIVYLLLLLLLKMYSPTVQWEEGVEAVKTFFAQTCRVSRRYLHGRGIMRVVCLC